MSPTRQNTLDEVTRRAREKYPDCLGIMLYGSFARGTETKDSDIDVFCILDDNDPAAAPEKAFSRTNTVETELWEVDGYEVEVHKAKLSLVHRMFSNLAQRASHYYVHVFSEAKALYEKDGLIQKLAAEAKKIHEDGPPFPSKEEIEFGRMVFSRGLVQVKRLLRDGSSAGMVRLMADMLFVNGVNGYCTVNRIWGGHKIPKLMDDSKTAHPRLYELCQNYLSSETNEQLLTNLEMLLDEAVEPVGWGAAQGRAPLKEARAQQSQRSRFFSRIASDGFTYSKGCSMNQSSDYNATDIAIIGMTGRFPKARNPEEFWDRLRYGENCISSWTEDELRQEGVAADLLASPSYVRASPVIDDPEMFDAPFFGVTAREAELMDPQHRLFLECCWEALEDAGYDHARYAKDIGVFAGARTNTYLLSNLLSHKELVESVGAFHLGLGNDLAFLTTRVSHAFNLRGPSCSLHVACSTSLVALHLACQSLLIDECQMALAGGVAINVPHKTGYLYEEGSVMSPDGKCRVFDAGARGTVFGNGIGVVVLKRLEDAVRDGDFIHAVIKGSAVNNDGASKASFTAPGIQGQIRVIKEAQKVSGVPPETITYIECHGTGTLLGDAVEIRALTKAFQGETSKQGFCAVGSVKSNVGHLDAAAGITGLIKVVQSLKHQLLPPSLYFKQPNPQIDFSHSPFYVNTELSPWKRESTPRRAGVSAFGVGGTNAHVIVEEAPPRRVTVPGRERQLLVLSARTPSAL